MAREKKYRQRSRADYSRGQVIAGGGRCREGHGAASACVDSARSLEAKLPSAVGKLQPCGRRDKDGGRINKAACLTRLARGGEGSLERAETGEVAAVRDEDERCYGGVVAVEGEKVSRQQAGGRLCVRRRPAIVPALNGPAGASC